MSLLSSITIGMFECSMLYVLLSMLLLSIFFTFMKLSKISLIPPKQTMGIRGRVNFLTFRRINEKKKGKLIWI